MNLFFRLIWLRQVASFNYCWCTLSLVFLCVSVLCSISGHKSIPFLFRALCTTLICVVWYVNCVCFHFHLYCTGSDVHSICSLSHLVTFFIFLHPSLCLKHTLRSNTDFLISGFYYTLPAWICACAHHRYLPTLLWIMPSTLSSGGGTNSTSLINWMSASKCTSENPLLV